MRVYFSEADRLKPAGSMENPCGKPFAVYAPMSSLDNLYLKMSPSLEPASLAGLQHDASHSDSQKQIGRDVAHELNNIFTIIRGYSERLLIRHGENPALRPELLLIAENMKRAESLVRHSTYPRSLPPGAVTAHSAVQQSV